MTVKIFISYAHEDKQYCERLVSHLAYLERNKKVEIWSDVDILPGQEWAKSINFRMTEADIILFLVSSDFIASDYCYQIELPAALERYNKNETVIIPIILRPTDWLDTLLGNFQALPKGGKPINNWGNQERAYLDIVSGLKKVISNLKSQAKINPTSNEKTNPEIETINKLREKIIAKCSMNEIKGICFNMMIDSENYPNSKSGLVREFLLDIKRKNRLDELIKTIEQLTPWVLD